MLPTNVQSIRTGSPPLVNSPAPSRQEVFPLNQQEVSDGLPWTLSIPPPPSPHVPPAEALLTTLHSVRVGLQLKAAMPLPAMAVFPSTVQFSIVALAPL